MYSNGNPRCQPFERLRTVSDLSSVKLNSKYQITVPLPVRQALHLSAGDSMVFEIKNNLVKPHRHTPLDLAYTQAMEGNLQEWSSSADDEAFKDL
jgi:antitoxin PrlF